MTPDDVEAHIEEAHKSHRAGWLRAAVLGVNDGVVSTASLMLGVSGASADRSAILTAGIAGLTAGALSMAVGEYVSVSSQRDSERADLEVERAALAADPDGELDELASIYVERGLEPDLAMVVATKLHERDALHAHARDELGIDQDALANPVQAVVASAASFAVGAIVPILAAVFASARFSTATIVIASLVLLAVSGAVGAAIGGGNKPVAAARVLIGGAAAMAVTYLIGRLVGTQV